jgi:hypothetical protein
MSWKLKILAGIVARMRHLLESIEQGHMVVAAFPDVVPPSMSPTHTKGKA